MDSQGILLSTFSLFAFLLLLPAFIWHCRCKNTPAIFLIFWLLFLDLNSFICAIIWSNENFYENWDGKVYCDIALKLELGSSCGKIAAVSALALNLYMVLCAKNPIFMGAKSKRKLFLDLAICLITPIFVMSTSYVVQASRYVVGRYRGCTNTFYYTYLSLIFYSIWNLIWAVVALVFAALTLIKYFTKKKDVNNILKCTNSGLNFRKFARLLIFSILIIIALVPLAVYNFASDAKYYRGPFIWKEIHTSYWGEIVYYDLGISTCYDRFIDIGLSFIAFIIFGLGSDALTMYKKILGHIGFSHFSYPDNVTLSRFRKSLPKQFRTNSNKSDFSEVSNWTNGSTMHDFSDYNEVVANKIQESPLTISKYSPTEISVKNFEKCSLQNTSSTIDEGV